MSITANPFSNHVATNPSTITSVPAPVVSPTLAETTRESFVERRESAIGEARAERRQFASSHSDLSPDAKELAIAIDRYKIDNRRRYITCEEMLAVVKQLGYSRG